MEKWNRYDKIDLKINSIEKFIGGEGDITIVFADSEKNWNSLYFDRVVDFRYGIEWAFYMRNRMQKVEHGDNPYSILCVENSETQSFSNSNMAYQMWIFLVKSLCILLCLTQ